jgi:zinc transporter
MTGFAYTFTDGRAAKTGIKEALAVGDGALVWIHLSTTNEHAQAALEEQAHLPDFVVSALTAAETRPRCDKMGHGVLLNLRGLSSEQLDGGDALASVRIYAHGNRVYSVTRKTLTATDLVCEDVEEGDIKDTGDLLARFATAITEMLDPVIAALGDSLDECESRLDIQHVWELRRHIAAVRVEAINYRRFVQPQRAALEKLAALPVPWLAEDDRLHLSAAADRAARMAEELESIRERAAVTNDALTDLRAEQIDQRSLVLGVMAVIFLPLTFITGLLGMNVGGIPDAEDPKAFWEVVGLCFVIAVVLWGWFRWRHWLRH